VRRFTISGAQPSDCGTQKGGEQLAGHPQTRAIRNAHRPRREIAFDMRHMRILGHHGPGVACETPPSPVDRSRVACYPVSLTGDTSCISRVLLFITAMGLLWCVCPDRSARSGVRRRTASASEV